MVPQAVGGSRGLRSAVGGMVASEARWAAADRVARCGWLERATLSPLGADPFGVAQCKLVAFAQDDNMRDFGRMGPFISVWFQMYDSPVASPWSSRLAVARVFVSS